MTFQTFVRQNARWLAGGVGLTFFASFGQTFFISMFAEQYRIEFGLSHGDFGSIYMLGTLSSAITLVFLGKVVDYYSVRSVTTVVILSLALACALMASVNGVIMLVFAIYLLRLAGQGMMSHTAMTAMGRWFVAERGRAVAVTSAGHQLGEAIFPFIVIVLFAGIDWRLIWWFCAAALALIALPFVRTCFTQDRTPMGTAQRELEQGRQWTRREVVRDPWFWLTCCGVLAPGFIGTSVWFHHKHLLQIKQWDASVLVAGFTMMSIVSVAMSLLTGQLIDRFNAYRLLPLILIPLSLGCLVLSVASDAYWLLVFMFMTGICYGLYGAIFGAVWSEVYGIRHLGAIRSVVFAGMVLSSALGPGLTGWLIDIGVGFEQQLFAMGIVCLFGMLILFPVSNRLHHHVLANAV